MALNINENGLFGKKESSLKDLSEKTGKYF